VKVKHRDRRTGEMKLKVQTLDDLWHLYNIIEKGDLVFALTTRREETRTDAIRAERGEKKRMRLGIRVEDVEFAEFSDWLRVHGVIEEGSQDLGSYHTLNISLDDDLSIVKTWTRHQLELVDRAERSAERPLVTMLAIDDDEGTVAQMREYGVRHVATIPSRKSGKQYSSKEEREPRYFDELLQAVKGSMESSALILLGPGFAKERLLEYGREHAPDLFSNCQVVSTGQSGMAGVQEVLKRGIGSRLLEESRVALETRLVERLFEEIAKDGLFVYGHEETLAALQAGAVETLLVTSKAARERRYEHLLELAEQTSSHVTIVSEVHDAGKRLEILGGVGAILRYRIG
jgi:protein pelota